MIYEHLALPKNAQYLKYALIRVRHNKSLYVNVNIEHMLNI